MIDATLLRHGNEGGTLEVLTVRLKAPIDTKNENEREIMGGLSHDSGKVP